MTSHADRRWQRSWDWVSLPTGSMRREYEASSIYLIESRSLLLARSQEWLTKMPLLQCAAFDVLLNVAF